MEHYTYTMHEQSSVEYTHVHTTHECVHTQTDTQTHRHTDTQTHTHTHTHTHTYVRMYTLGHTMFRLSQTDTVHSCLVSTTTAQT